MSRPTPLIAAVALAAAGALVLSGCSNDDAADTPTSTSDGAASGDPGQRGDQGFGGGGVNGEIVSVSGTTLQVQGSDSQTAVVVTDDTEISATVAAALADVTVGSCVTVTSSSGQNPGESQDDAAASDEESSSTDTAASVVVSDPVDGECSAGAGPGGGTPGGDGAPSGDMPTDMPSGMPTDMPSDAPGDGDGATRPSGAPSDVPEGGQGGGMPGGARTSGLVTAVDETAITVGTTGDDATTETVAIDESTSFTRTTSADQTALVTGMCASVQGGSGDDGQVTAERVTVSEPGDEGCSGRRGGNR